MSKRPTKKPTRIVLGEGYVVMCNVDKGQDTMVGLTKDHDAVLPRNTAPDVVLKRPPRVSIRSDCRPKYRLVLEVVE